MDSKDCRVRFGVACDSEIGRQNLHAALPWKATTFANLDAAELVLEVIMG